MDDFLGQFLAQAWRFIALLGGLVVITFFLWQRERAKKVRQIQERKEAINPNAVKSQQNEKSKKFKQRKNAPKPEPVMAASETIQEPSFTALLDDDDPLAELYAIRAEVGQESGTIATQVQGNIDADVDEILDDEDAVDLASLLVDMAEADVPPLYHVVSDKPVAVQLDTGTKTAAVELLSISRDDRDSRLMVQVGDAAYRTLLDDKSVKSTFTKTMKELSQILLTPDSGADTTVDTTGLELHTMTNESIHVQVASGGETTAREMISILRDEADGHLIIQIGKKGYRTLADNPKVKSGFSKIMKELSTVVLTVDDNPPEVRSSVALDVPTSLDTMAYEDEADDAVLPGDIRIRSMDEMPTGYEKGRFGQIIVKEVEQKVEEINIAKAIETYLQYKISKAPEMQNRGIHIRSGLGGGVRIEVEGKSYDFVDEVEQADARDFIQQAINEWQERH